MTELTRSDVKLAIGASSKSVLIRIVDTKGSAPRSMGAAMLVIRGAEAANGVTTKGTIGGGQAEWLAMQRGEAILNGTKDYGPFTLTLGPEIDQCCGGVMVLTFERPEETDLDEVFNRPASNVYVFGAGHTGLALANAFAPLGFRTHLVDTRQAYDDVHRDVKIVPMPETIVREAEPASAFVVTTHAHHLDFLITAEALARGDAAYVGMIGSKTKRAAFSHWLKDNGYGALEEDALHCPIGRKAELSAPNERRPAVIAAMSVVEIMDQFARSSVATNIKA